MIATHPELFAVKQLGASLSNAVRGPSQFGVGQSSQNTKFADLVTLIIK